MDNIQTTRQLNIVLVPTETERKPLACSRRTYHALINLHRYTIVRHSPPHLQPKAEVSDDRR
jgi:hypothetical protein